MIQGFFRGKQVGFGETPLPSLRNPLVSFTKWVAFFIPLDCVLLPPFLVLKSRVV